jgi:superfamily II RNA helicase
VAPPLYRQLLAAPNAAADELLGCFLDYVAEKRLELYPSQEAAILELFDEKNVILNTPTGSGKSLVATALHFKSLAQGRRSVYTCPIKALVNEKFLALCRDFGPEQVGMSTGDASVNRDAPILCCTAEILANMALRQGRNAPVQEVIMDEFHYYADRDRGVAWQAPLLTLPQARFLLMSATLGDTSFFEGELTALNGRRTAVIQSNTRPVPLEYRYSESGIDQALQELVAANRAPVYVVHFTQLDAAQGAQNLMSLNFCSRDEKEAIAAELQEVKFSSPYGPDIRRWLRHGIGLHHAGLLPKYRVLVEKLAQRGLLKVICGTDTLGVGINVPIRTVLLTRLCKFDGQKTVILSARDFHQITGRAGRKGFDDRGWVVVQAPEHVIENLKLEQKSAGDPGKLRKLVKRKPPEKGFLSWDKNTFARLMGAQPERLTSRFQVSHGMLLNVLSREGDGCRAMQDLIHRCHESPRAKQEHRRRAWQLFRSLVDRKIIEIIPRTDSGSYLRVNVELQDDFSLDQTLSLYLIDTLRLLDPAAPDYALDLLTLVESILENPELILRKQLDRLKAQRLAEMKLEGMDYMERMEELEKLEYPKPRRDFIYSTFNQFAASHPWVGEENIRPKSIAREMYENFRSFADYIKDYELQRAEGLLLRHLGSVYKVLVQTVPETAKTEAVREMELYFGAMIRQVDSSLLEEWNRLRAPTGALPGVDAAASPTPSAPGKPADAQAEEADITSDPKTFTMQVRTAIFSFLRALAGGDHEAGLALLDSLEDELRQAWTAKALAEAIANYHVDHERVCFEPEARNLRHTHLKVAEDRQSWRVAQTLVDPEGLNDWSADFLISLSRSRETGQPSLQLLRLGPVAMR